MGFACAEGTDSAIDGTCYKGTVGCQCLEGTCEIGVCSPTSGRCVFEGEEDGTGTGTDDGTDEEGESGLDECDLSASVGCPCGDGISCAPGLECQDGECENPGDACGGADLLTDPENCGACGRVCPEPGPGYPPSCKLGTCTPAFGDCFSPDMEATTCADQCEAAGLTCSDGACQGRVVMRFADANTCDGFETGEVLPHSCGELIPTEDLNANFRCCCAEE
jgi:hypothetical protein